MVETFDNTTGGLHEQQFLAICLATGERGRDHPAQQDRAGAEQCQPSAAVPLAGQLACPRMPERAQQERKGDMQQHDRPLAHQSGRHRQGKSGKPGALTHIATHQCIQRGQHAQREQRFVHDLQTEQERVAESGKQPRCQPRNLWFARKQHPRKALREQQHARTDQHLKQARPDIADATDCPARMDQPEQQRHLVTVRHSVVDRHQELTTVPHFPGNPERARGIGWHRPGLEYRNQRRAHPQPQPGLQDGQQPGAPAPAGQMQVQSASEFVVQRR